MMIKSTDYGINEIETLSFRDGVRKRNIHHFMSPYENFII